MGQGCAMKRMFALTLSVALALLVAGCRSTPPVASAPAVEAGAAPFFEVIEAPRQPVIDRSHPDLAGNQFGFEGGHVIKQDGRYHLFTAEIVSEPFSAKTRLAHWSSPDGFAWRRVATLYESSGRLDTNDTRFSLWSPIPIYNEREGRWNLFYIAYRPRGTTPAEVDHMDGRVWRAVSVKPGRAGLGGPYRDAGIVLQPDAASQPWEGQQGTASFHAWPVGGRWLAFYGSHNHIPRGPWRVGLAEAPALAGPWVRCADNPSPIEEHFIENPLVTRVGRPWVAIYDSSPVDAQGGYVPDGQHIGYAVSPDGRRWPVGRRLNLQPGDANWSDDLRTPLSLIPEGGGVYTIFYTARLRGELFWTVGIARVRLAAGR